MLKNAFNEFGFSEELLEAIKLKGRGTDRNSEKSSSYHS